MNEGFELMVRFDRDTADFARGVEVGMLWQRLCTEALPVVAIVHTDNAEMAIRLGEASGVTASAVDENDDWLTVTYR